MKNVLILTLLVIGGLFALPWLATPTWASGTGISGHSGNPATNFGMSCNACHGGGSEPVVSLTGPQTVLAGESVVYTLHVQSTALALQTAAGLDVSATGGTLTTTARVSRAVAPESSVTTRSRV